MRRERRSTNKPTNQKTKRKIAATINLITIIKCLLQRRERERERDEKNFQKKKKNYCLSFVTENDGSNGFCKKPCTQIAQTVQKETHFYHMSSHGHHHLISFFLLHPVAVDCTHGYSVCLCGDDGDDGDDDAAAAVRVLAALRD